MKLISKKDNKLVFSAEVGESLANAIRRSALEIPILAIDEIEFKKNDSVLYDEVMALRLGLIPLKTEKSFAKNIEVKLKLSAKGPCTVYSGDLKPSDPKTVVVDDKIPITKLLDGKKIKIEAVAMLGQGKEHAKWQPAVVSYGYDKGADKYRFMIESHGGLDADKIVAEAAKMLGEKAKEFGKLIK